MSTNIEYFRKLIQETLDRQNNPFPNSKVKNLVYHSTFYKFHEFDLDRTVNGPRNNSSGINGIYFGNKKSTAFGNNIITAYINLLNPVIIDMSNSAFDSGSVQEAIYAAIISDETYYLIHDLIEYGGMDDEEAEELVYFWHEHADGAILLNTNYSSHSQEYIVFKNPWNKKQNSDITKQIHIVEVEHPTLSKWDDAPGFD